MIEWKMNEWMLECWMHYRVNKTQGWYKRYIHYEWVYKLILFPHHRLPKRKHRNMKTVSKRGREFIVRATWDMPSHSLLYARKGEKTGHMDWLYAHTPATVKETTWAICKVNPIVTDDSCLSLLVKNTISKPKMSSSCLRVPHYWWLWRSLLSQIISFCNLKKIKLKHFNQVHQLVWSYFKDLTVILNNIAWFFHKSFISTRKHITGPKRGSRYNKYASSIKLIFLLPNFQRINTKPFHTRILVFQLTIWVTYLCIVHSQHSSSALPPNLQNTHVKL